jgi:hypothetical protein
MKLTKTLFIVVNIVLFGLQLIIANIRSSDGDEIALIGNQIEQINTQNRQLESLIYSKSSLSYIQSKAIQSGLIQLNTTQLTPLTVANSYFSQP